MASSSPHAAIWVLDLFAGPGGWDYAAHQLGLDPLGVEWDDAACETRKAAGLRTLQGDVAQMDPDGFGPIDLLIASPPCQAWSMAGKRLGEKDKEHVVACAMELAAGNDTRIEHGEKCEDPRSMLVVEPIRFIRALKPDYVALEQVPPVLELWTLFASLIEPWGYKVWTGVLEAERYGVPQTRERAILMASRVGPVAPPQPTHQRYIPGEPARHDITLEGEVLPWVSMAQALGGCRHGYGYNAVAARGAGMRELHGEREPTPVNRPAPAVTSHARDAQWQPTHLDTRQSHAQARPIDLPAPAMVGQNLAKAAAVWTDNPATETTEGTAYKPTTGLRVTEQEAAILQSFPPDYPWQGSRSKKFEQIGNAVPPRLAEAVLRSLLGPEADSDQCVGVGELDALGGGDGLGRVVELAAVVGQNSVDADAVGDGESAHTKHPALPASPVKSAAECSTPPAYLNPGEPMPSIEDAA